MINYIYKIYFLIFELHLVPNFLGCDLIPDATHRRFNDGKKIIQKIGTGGHA
jgi:hypothetical protein